MPDPLVDFHCHLDLYPDHAELVRRCEKDGVFTLSVTTTPKAWARNYELTAHTKYVRTALGLHPQLVAERAEEIRLWEELLPKARYVGEVGLDAGPRFYKSLNSQKAIFKRVLQACSKAGDKILTVHSVRSATAVLDMIEAYMPPTRGVTVLHWFTGTAAEAKRAVALGCYFSINAQMLTSEARRAAVSRLPHERLLTETDGPFTQTDDRPSLPGDVRTAVDALAKLFGQEPDHTRTLIAQNLKSLVAGAH